MGELGTIVLSNLGYPRIGERREWKRALEAHWRGELSEAALDMEMKALRMSGWKKQHAAGVDWIPVGDFTTYDHMLDHSVAFGIVPSRFAALAGQGVHALTFAMARGSEDMAACELTKWFNTIYQYIVPEWEDDTTPRLQANPWRDAYLEAREALGDRAAVKPVLVGPYTYAKLSKGISPADFAGAVRSLLPVYGQALAELEACGADWVQLDEPALVGDVPAEHWPLIEEVYTSLTDAAPKLRIMLQTYFGAVADYERVVRLPVAGIGLDFVHDNGASLAAVASHGFPERLWLGAGLVDGRNIWRTDLTEALALAESLALLVPSGRIALQPSCSLLHVPVTLRHEHKLQGLHRYAMAFADEKLGELRVLRSALTEGKEAVKLELTDSGVLQDALRKSRERNRLGGIAAAKRPAAAPLRRTAPFAVRYAAQQAALQLPPLPTTTVGSLPQTADVRKARADWRRGTLSDAGYTAFIRGKIAEWIGLQEELGLDVLGHGEFERDDRVEFFGQKLDGYLLTENGWVQSYGTRCVKPPVIFGDVVWKGPITVDETAYAQTLTTRPVKGMLAGPMAMMNGSFIRTDIPRQDVAFQLAAAIRAEVKALEDAGIGIIQVDEPALRDGAPLRKADWDGYLAWAVEAFRLTVAAVKDTTQIHTHMCYCDYHEMLDAIEAMDADVISLETSRSHGTLIDALRTRPYGQGIGLGVYDIHSPYVPDAAAMERILREAAAVVDPRLLWVNPDCGLKTRSREETLAALRQMVEAANRMRGLPVGAGA